MSILSDVSYVQPVHGSNKLLYTDKAARLLQELCVPAHRNAVASGKWADGNPPVQKLLGIIRQVSALAVVSGRCGELPAITAKEEAAARALIGLLDYAEQTGLHLGRAVMLVHAADAARPGSKQTVGRL